MNVISFIEHWNYLSKSYTYFYNAFISILAMNNTLLIYSIEELNTLAQSLIQTGYQKFLLEGELWVGKTQFVKGIVQALWGNPDEVQSPTYTYMNPYITPRWDLVHMDLYRFESQENAFSKGIFEAIDNHDYICIEWPKREEFYVDATRVRLQFSFQSDGSRTITLSSLS